MAKHASVYTEYVFLLYFSFKKRERQTLTKYCYELHCIRRLVTTAPRREKTCQIGHDLETLPIVQHSDCRLDRMKIEKQLISFFFFPFVRKRCQKKTRVMATINWGTVEERTT